MPKLINTKIYLEKAKKVHGDLYSYEYLTYINSYEKIKIICKKHGIFEQIPATHLRGSGCPDCFGKNKSNTEDFIKKSIKIHGNKYDYDKVDYENNKTKIIITCKEHGDFLQSPFSHLSGNGCIDCSNVKKSNVENFIFNSIKSHGEKYDYSLVNYVNNNIKVKIICKEHGIFNQSPHNHLSGHACPKCSKPSSKYSEEEFIKRATLKHCNKYSYDEIIYINFETKVNIRCKIHGIFQQEPTNHLYGQGCPFCKESKGERKICDFLIANNIKFTRQKKFSDCKNKRKLSFDFYLPDYNILIEYDGIQHFESFKFFGGEEKFIKRKINDEIKNNFCKNIKIELFRIPYYNFEIIKDILKFLKRPDF